jgi:hypothetical protein
VYGVGPPGDDLRDVVDAHDVCIDSVDVSGVGMHEVTFPEW